MATSNASVAGQHGDALPDRREFRSARYSYTFGDHPPELVVKSGAKLRVICPDSDNFQSDGTELTADQRRCESGVAEGNPLAGPIAIEGSEAGDVIAVTIEAVMLDRNWGRTLLAPNHGFVPGELLGNAGEAVPERMYRWEIDVAAGVARVTNPLGSEPIVVPLLPFVGCIGVCAEARVSTLYAGNHGGNLDVPGLGAGATLYLPVFRAGGLLMLGDLHAAQGYGEIIGGGIETSGVVDCALRLIKGCPIPSPRLLSGGNMFAIATAAELGQAVREAYGKLVQWLAELGMNRWDAYNLVSQTGSVVLGNLVSGTCTVAAGLPVKALPGKAPERFEMVYGG